MFPDSFGLLITATGVDHYSPLVAKSLQVNTSTILQWQQMCQTTDLEDCVLLKTFNQAFDDFRKATPGAGAYFNEADFFENNWQDEFWGMENYLRLTEIKRKWDPDQLFYCHKCVGSENWEEGGMCRL